MIGSHEEEPCRLFDQAIYTYLISCRVGSGFRVGLSGQAFQPDPSSRIQLLNPTRHFSQKISNPTRRGQSIYLIKINRIISCSLIFQKMTFLNVSICKRTKIQSRCRRLNLLTLIQTSECAIAQFHKSQ